MIFVTVGTHEQPFDRLLRAVDELKKEGTIREDVQMQTGYGTYVPEACGYVPWLSYTEMEEAVAKARIVITHGGPASFMAPLQKGKIPVVVPRDSRFGEHVNDHQIEFCRKVAERYDNLILVEDVAELGKILQSYEEIANTKRAAQSHTAQFNEKFEKIVEELF